MVIYILKNSKGGAPGAHAEAVMESSEERTASFKQGLPGHHALYLADARVGSEPVV